MGAGALLAGFRAVPRKDLQVAFEQYPGLKKAYEEVTPESGKPASSEVSCSMFRILMPAVGWAKARSYLRDLRANIVKPGKYLQKQMGSEVDLNNIDYVDLVKHLLHSKHPQIFAESAVRGDGKDWNQRELTLLGDVSFAVPVEIFDNGAHANPTVHPEPFSGTLLYTCGALLRPDNMSADWSELVRKDSDLDDKAFFNIYNRRLYPCFQYANDCACKAGRQAFITIPGLGCGQFAGRFQGTLGQKLADQVKQILVTHGASWQHIHAVYYDAFRETEASREMIEGINFIIQPLGKSGGKGCSQLCRPQEFEGAVTGEADNFAKCDLFSMVAWDHVSWPGNDYWGGSRATDDGVKAAATDSMYRLSGVKGVYNAKSTQYEPPDEYRCWYDVLRKNKIKLDLSSLKDDAYDVNGFCDESHQTKVFAELGLGEFATKLLAKGMDEKRFLLEMDEKQLKEIGFTLEEETKLIEKLRATPGSVFEKKA